MKQSLGLVSLVVRDYDEAIAFFVGTLGFRLVEDTYVPEQAKRWVVVAPPGATGCQLLLARASTPEQEPRIGDQTGGRVGWFLHTDDFWRDYADYRAKGVVFVREPKQQPYGTVAVFRDLYGNLWDLVEPTAVADDPVVAIGHVVLPTDRMADTCQFLRALGMRSVFAGAEVAVFELRGGTHVLAMRRDTVVAGDAPFDLMVDDLSAMHRRLTDLGLAPSPIEPRPAIDHEVFTVREPAGHLLTIFSSHATDGPG